jgi:hypothetical protein
LIIITKVFAHVRLLLSYHHFLLYATFYIITIGRSVPTSAAALFATSSYSSSPSSIFPIVLTPITLMLLFSLHEPFRS